MKTDFSLIILETLRMSTSLTAVQQIEFDALVKAEYQSSVFGYAILSVLGMM